ncbi:hypothetical protein Nepgr_016943 [Nepenthes gracilis]|uniref:BAG domain-containing protein n=1 Tax=Nepenthes gracilis TaxID=150966 RepID=A0AAD3XRR3_NEPGR|nr:hypothetical protein Nepgr_016943 [Nepenthes gracilis]
MIDSPFFRSRRGDYLPARITSSPKSKPNVISIPVRFVGSEKSRSESVLKIQKSWRGFRVRKNVKKILAIKREVGEIEKRISERETLELIRRDEKEILKVTETLMALLFRLDSIHAVDDAVRDCRKAVTRKAISLQEMVDSIVAADRSVEDFIGRRKTTEIAGSADQAALDAVAEGENMAEPAESSSDDVARAATIASEAMNSESAEEVIGKNTDPMIQIEGIDHLIDSLAEVEGGGSNTGFQCLETQEKDPTGIDSACDYDDDDNQTMEVIDSAEYADHLGESEGLSEQEEEIPQLQESNESAKLIPEAEGKMGLLEIRGDAETKADMSEGKITEENCEKFPACSDRRAEILETGQTENNDSETFDNSESWVQGGKQDEVAKGNHEIGDLQPTAIERELSENSYAMERKEYKRNRELLERMMEENGKMMTMMRELFETTQTQSRMLSSLRQRVDQLERAFICDRLKRKKSYAAYC